MLYISYKWFPLNRQLSVRCNHELRLPRSNLTGCLLLLFSGKILLQTTPSYLVTALDKALREASTLEGVLELRNEHFWTVGFGTLVGSLYVRVRRDASEQLVLAHVTKRLHPFVKNLTIQVWCHVFLGHFKSSMSLNAVILNTNTIQ